MRTTGQTIPMAFAGTTARTGSGRVDGRSLLLVAILAAVWVSFNPFQDLGDADAFDIGSGRDTLTYGVFALFAACVAGYIGAGDRHSLRLLAQPAYLLLMMAMAMSCVISQDPATSIKRAVMFVLVAVSAAAIFLLPRNRAQMASVFATCGLAFLVASYAGLLLLPGQAIHQASDVTEPLLAGDWRGLFPHKNVASAMFALLAFVGLFVRSCGHRLQGLTICIASLAFVLGADGKSAMVLVVLTLLLSRLAMSLTSIWTWSIAVFTPFLGLELLGVGSVISPRLAAITGALPLDATFTGRTDVWRFAVERAAQKLWTGYGLSAFWNTAELRFGSEDATSWAGNAAHAHNGYLDVVLSMGIPGLCAMVLATILQPVSDFRRARLLDRDRVTILLLLRIWMFCLYLSAMETYFFDRANPLWVMFLFAILGLRLTAGFRIRL